jgi:hypothetical protein
MTTTSGLWIPGAVTPTNEAISLARGDGYHQGYGRAMVERGAWRSLRHQDERYGSAAARTRLAAAVVARHLGRCWAVEAGRPVRLRFSVQGQPRIDVAGAYLAAKWLEDGLVDAGVLPSDRQVVESTVTVVRGADAVVGDPGVYLSFEAIR